MRVWIESAEILLSYVSHFAEVREHVVARLPLLIGSGVTLDNVDNYANAADALIVGSHLKIAGRWENAPDPERVQAFVGHLKGQERLWQFRSQRAREPETGSCSTSWASFYLWLAASLRRRQGWIWHLLSWRFLMSLKIATKYKENIDLVRTCVPSLLSALDIRNERVWGV